MAIGKVIKGESQPELTQDRDRSVASPRPRAGVVNAEVYEAHQSAQQIVEAAQKRAGEILEAAKKEREQVVAEAREAGRQEGLAQAAEVIARAHLLRGEILAKSEREVVALALKVAEKIIGRDLERSPQVVVDICATAIEAVRNVSQMVIRANPRDIGILKEHRKRLMEMIGRVKDISLKEDPEVPSGGCVIETESGTVDAQLSTQFEMLRNLLLAEEKKKEGAD